MGNDIIVLSTENDDSKNKIGPYDEKWLEESKTKLFKVNNDENRTNLFMSRMKKQIGKQKINGFYILQQNMGKQIR